MKRGSLSGCIFLTIILIVISLVSAIETEITIKTMPSHEVKLTVLKHSETGLEFNVLERLSGESDIYGDLVLKTTVSEDNFDLAIDLKKNGERVLFEKFLENYPSGEPIYIEIATEGFEFLTNPAKIPKTCDSENLDLCSDETNCANAGGFWYEEKCNQEAQVVETPVEETQESEEQAPVTGATISEEMTLPENFFYYVGGFLALLLLIFTTVGITKYKMKKRVKNHDDIKIKKLSELKEEKTEKIKDYREIIEDAERKIKEAQEEIIKIKQSGELKEKEERIKEAKKKLIEDERELMRLRGELKEKTD